MCLGRFNEENKLSEPEDTNGLSKVIPASIFKLWQLRAELVLLNAEVEAELQGQSLF